jgi:hypothetical protein
MASASAAGTGAWRDLGASASQLWLAPTLLSGMSFRWRQATSHCEVINLHMTER